MRDERFDPGGPERRVWTVAELNEAIRAALQTAFPGAVWVRGEVQRLPRDAASRRHVYFELHGTTPDGAAVAIPVALLEWDRRRYGLQRYLDGSDPDFRLADKMEVCLQCVVDFYPPFGKLQLKLVGIDPAYTLGRLEALRRRTLAYLEKQGLLERQRRLPWPELPLRVGLITSAGSAAERDFVTGLQASGYGFRVLRADCRMMGQSMVPQVTAALAGLARSGVDVIVLTRGGGSRADLSWFDVQEVAVAVATCPVPVLTAIGHEIDRSIADVVAHHACKTPTAAAEELVRRVADADARLADAAAGIAATATRRLEQARAGLREAGRRLRLGVDRRVGRGLLVLGTYRTRLAAAALPAVSRRQERVRGAAARLAAAVPATVRRAEARLRQLVPLLAAPRLLRPARSRRGDLARLASRLDLAAHGRLQRADRRLAALADKARLLDPDRLLARGWSVTLAADGRVVRSAAQVAQGDELETRLHDGRIGSRVVSVERREPAPGKE